MLARKNIFCFLFLATLLTKVSAFHVYSHHSDEEHDHECELCENAIQQQQSEFSATFQIQIPENQSTPLHKTQQVLLNSQIESGDYIAIHFTRPPPKA